MGGRSRVGRAIRRIGRLGEDIVRGTVDTVGGIVGGLTGKEPELPEVTEPITQQEKPVEEVVTPIGQLNQSGKKDTSDTGMGDVESIFNAITSGDSSDPFSSMLKKKEDEEKKKKSAVM